VTLALLYTFIILAAEGGGSSNGSVIFVAVIGGLSAVVGAYFAYKGSRKQSDVQETTTERTSILDERKQISDEWKTLREYKDLQLTASRKENEALQAQIRVLESSLDESNALINQLVKTLNRTGLGNIIPKEIQNRVDASNDDKVIRDDLNETKRQQKSKK
jgi:hypothetical protein